MKRKLALLSVIAVVANPVFADQTKRNWSASAEVGLNFTSGNTKTSSIKTRLEGKQKLEQWNTHYLFDALRKKDNGVESASKWLVSAKGNYKLNEKNAFMFITGSREEDDFSSYDNYNTVAFGYGKRLLERESLTIDADIGPGYAFFTRNDAEKSTDNSAIVSMSGTLSWDISENADFGQRLVVIQELSDGRNTKTRLESSLSSSINGSLRMKLGLTILNNTEVPEGTKRTDTETSITLIYKF